MVHAAAILMALRGIAIGDFAYVDTSGEAVQPAQASDQAAAHARQLQGFVAALRRDFERQGSYRLVSLPCGTSCMDVELTELARMASATGANIVVIGGIHKMSTLVQWARVEAIDVDTNRVLLDRLFTFRGDNSQAWDRAEAFVFREVQAGLSVEPVTLSVLDFQLDDFSAGASGSPNVADAEKLAAVTRDVRRLLAQSGRYRLVDAQAAQTFSGTISRISRTEYTVKFQIRDVRTGDVISSADSGLRLGADYSWSRGAVRLVEDQVLAAGGG